jgi:hypothetical protein
MAATVDISRVYLNEDGQGVITCHHCDAQRPIQTSQHLHESIHRKLIKGAFGDSYGPQMTAL